MTTSPRKALWLFLTAILLVGGIVSASALLRKRDEPTQLLYTVAPVTRGDIVRSVSASGQLSPIASVEVSSQISGLVTEVSVNFGSSVKQGQVLARVDSSTYEQKLRQARADLAAARATYSLAEIDARRIRGLSDQDLVTRQERDSADALLEQAKARLLAGEAAVQNALVDLQRCAITSPIDGIVIFKQIEVGKTIVSSLSAPVLFTIAPSLSRMRIIAQISEVDISDVHKGQDVLFTVDAIPGRHFRGVLTEIHDPYIPSDKQQQQSKQNAITTFETVIELDNPSQVLRPGLTANVSVVVERRSNVLQIPNSALRVKLTSASAPSSASDSAATIYRMPGADRMAQPEAVQIELGATDSLLTEVRNGLSEGNLVVTGSVIPNEQPNRSLFGFGL